MQAVANPCLAKVTAAFVPPPPEVKTIFLISTFEPRGKQMALPVEKSGTSRDLKLSALMKMSRVAEPIEITSNILGLAILSIRYYYLFSLILQSPYPHPS